MIDRLVRLVRAAGSLRTRATFRLLSRPETCGEGQAALWSQTRALAEKARLQDLESRIAKAREVLRSSYPTDAGKAALAALRELGLETDRRGYPRALVAPVAFDYLIELSRVDNDAEGAAVSTAAALERVHDRYSKRFAADPASRGEAFTVGALREVLSRKWIELARDEDFTGLRRIAFGHAAGSAEPLGPNWRLPDPKTLRPGPANRRRPRTPARAR